MTILFANNASTTLAAQLTAGATSASLTSGSSFPSPSGGDVFYATLTQGSGAETSWEIVKCTARSTNTLTIVRAQEGTSDVTWAAGSKIEIRLTAGVAEGKSNQTGFPVDSNGAYLCNLTYNETTRTVTATPTGASFDIYAGGAKYTKTGAQSIQHTATYGKHFIYFDSDGVLTVSQTAWDLLKHVPVSLVFWDSTNSKGVPFDERHHAGRDLYWHRNQHAAEGTKTTSGFGISGYTLSNGSADSAVTFAIASGVVEDEDVIVTTQALPDNGPYTLVYRSGASGDYVIDRSPVLPFKHSGSQLQYNQFTGATWQLTGVTEDNYVNYWVFALTALPTTDISPSPTTTQQFVIFPGQTIYSTEALAHAETAASLTWGTLPFMEMAPLYQITLRYNASNPSAYANTASCAITRVMRIVGTNASVSQAAQTDHGALAGLADDDHTQYAKTEGTHRVIFNVTDPPTDGHALKFDQTSGKFITGPAGSSSTTTFASRFLFLGA